MVDIGKICALYKAGWDEDKIADEVNSTEEEVNDILNEHFRNYKEGDYNVGDKIK